MTTAAQHLVKHGIRLSMQRMAIMQYLLDHHTHPTVDTIYKDLLQSMPTLSRTTVYNTLELLRENNAVHALTIDKRTVHYDGQTHPHAHFLCRRCGEIFDMEVDECIAGHLHASDDFKIERYELYYSGLCPKCKAQEQIK